MEENGNGKATFDFSLITAFRVMEKVSEKYFEAGFGAENIQEHLESPQETPKNIQEEIVAIIKYKTSFATAYPERYN